MKSRALFLSLALFLMFSTVQASDYSESFNVYQNSGVELEGYEFRYSDSGGEQLFTVVREDDGSSFIEHQFRGDEVFEEIDELREIDSDTSYRISDIGADDDGLFLELEVNASRPIFDSAEISTDDPSNVFVAQDDELEITLELENTGVVDQTFELNAETHDSINTFFLFDEFEVSEIEVPRGETETLILELDVPSDTPTGSQQVNITAEGNTEASETFSFEVRGQQVADPSLDMTISDSFIRMTPGQTENIPVNLLGRSERPVEDIEIEAESEGLDVEAPDGTVSLGEFDSEEVVLQVEAPEGAEPGDYFVEVTANTEGLDPETEEVRVNVSEESMLRYVGLLIMIVSVGALAGVYRRFGRR